MFGALELPYGKYFLMETNLMAMYGVVRNQ